MKDATQFHIRPARPEEAGLFYTPHPEEDKRLGTVGHVRMDFGRSGNEFWHTWWPRGPEELNSPAFKAELQEVVDTLRESVLKNRFAMERFCYEHGGKISGGWTQNYGYIVETERYRYCLTVRPVALCPALWYTAHSCYEMTFFNRKSQRTFTCQIVQNTKWHLKRAKTMQISGIGHSVIRGLVTTGQWFSASTTVYPRGSPQGRRHSYFVDC